MLNPLTLQSLKKVALAGVVMLIVAVGVGAVLRSTVDYLLNRDATAAAENWARYVAENIIDIEEIANGARPSGASMDFFIRTQQIRHVFGFEILDLQANVKLASDGSSISTIREKVHR